MSDDAHGNHDERSEPGGEGRKRPNRKRNSVILTLVNDDKNGVYGLEYVPDRHVCVVALRWTGLAFPALAARV